jgi:hypothetical protein
MPLVMHNLVSFTSNLEGNEPKVAQAVRIEAATVINSVISLCISR